VEEVAGDLPEVNYASKRERNRRSMPKKPIRRPHCYICASVDVKLTDDHIPPESFFPDDQRGNLFVAPLCETCHKPLSMDDEVMRWFLTIVEGVSKSGARIFKEKAQPRMKSQPKLWENIKPYLKTKWVTLPSGIIEQRVVAGLLQARAMPFIRRLTKGFLYLFYPDYDYLEDHFTVVGNLRFEDLLSLIAALKHNSRGDNVFDVWHGFTTDGGDGAVWVYRFYDATNFVCFHGKRKKWVQTFSAGYKEWHKLPKFL